MAREADPMAADAPLRFDRRLYEELWSRGDLAVVDELIAPDVVFDGQPLGQAGYRAWVTGFRRAFPDLQAHIEQQVADAQSVVSRLAWRGTNAGELLPQLLPGWAGPAIGPTGKTVAWTLMTLHRLVDGRLAEGWLNADLFSLLRQLGVLPSG
jgi:predicted ester cyclase